MKRIIFLGFLLIIFAFFYAFEEPSHSSFGAHGEKSIEINKYDHAYPTFMPDNSNNIYWAKTYGGGAIDATRTNFSVQATSDEGYIIGGQTYSFGAGLYDIWVLKLNSYGDIEWQRTYGGSEWDINYAGIHETSDGGFIVGGTTGSFGAGSYDFWILKLDSNGDIEWQRTYGGSGWDWSYSIQVTSDGGYIIAGITDSFGAGSYDIWVLKLNSSGDIEWQRTYGGSGVDTEFLSAQQTGDGGYIVGGSTGSFGAGSHDFWVLKLDSNGDIEWQRTYGGEWGETAYSIQQTADGGYIIGGNTLSFGAGGRDSWILKLDSNGDIEWQRTYGGSGGWDNCASIQETSDGGYIFAGGTDSFGAGGGQDIWILKLFSNGDVEWQRTYGGSGERGDYSWFIQETSDGGYIFAGGTDSFGAGDGDILIMKLSPIGDISSCGMIGDLNASVSDTSISPLDTSVTPINTHVVPQNTNIQPQESDAIVYNVCPGSYTLTLSATPGGTTDPEPGIYTYDGGTYVTIQANPDSGYRFTGWSLNGGKLWDNPIAISMDSDISIAANFSVITTPEDGGDGSSRRKGGCFIATAAYGSPLHSHVSILRDFRDRYLMPTKLGRTLVYFYYRYSPSVADLIAKHSALKVAVRINLMPLIALSYSMLHFGPVITTIMLFFILSLSILPILFLRS